MQVSNQDNGVAMNKKALSTRELNKRRLFRESGKFDLIRGEVVLSQFGLKFGQSHPSKIAKEQPICRPSRTALRAQTIYHVKIPRRNEYVADSRPRNQSP